MNHPCAPILSVITPTFNSLPFIEECILHVESERIDGIEHVIIDGASTDGTEALISKLAKSRPYVNWISEPDTGQSSAMNRGIALAKGRFICFLNVDDYFEPACLKLVVSKLLKLSENQFLVGNCNVVNGQGKLLSVRKPSKCGYPQILQFWKPDVFPPNPSSYFYPKSIHEMAGLYDEDEHYVLDYEMFVRILRFATPHYINHTLGNFVLHDNTKTFLNTRDSKRPSKLHVYEKYLRNLPKWQQWTFEVQRWYHTELKRSNNRLIFFTLRPMYALRYVLKKFWQG